MQQLPAGLTLASPFSSLLFPINTGSSPERGQWRASSSRAELRAITRYAGPDLSISIRARLWLHSDVSGGESNPLCPFSQHGL